MHTGHIKGATRVLGAPKGWDRETQGPCGGLVIRDDLTTAGPSMTSAWFPTSDEIERIRNGAPIYLTVIGIIHPPVAMSVGPQPGTE
jgi:hypothetical protein